VWSGCDDRIRRDEVESEEDKDEGARLTVNQRGDSLGDVSPADGWFAIRDSPLHTGSKASKGRTT